MRGFKGISERDFEIHRDERNKDGEDRKSVV